MNNWFYKGNEITDITQFPKGTVSFVYKITHKNSGKYYVGKKILRNVINKKLGKKEIAEYKTKGLKGRPPTKKKVIRESNWKTYYGSNSQLVEDVKKLGFENFDREIIKICFSKKEATYYEVYYQFLYKVLEDPLSYNTNILGSFYKKDFEN